MIFYAVYLYAHKKKYKVSDNRKVCWLEIPSFLNVAYNEKSNPLQMFKFSNPKCEGLIRFSVANMAKLTQHAK